VKRFGFFYKSLILLICLLLFAVTTPAFGGEIDAPASEGFSLAIDSGGGDVLTSLSIDDVVDYAHDFKYVAALDSAGYISPAIYKAPVIVQHRDRIVSAQYDKFEARSPDKILISMDILGGKQVIFACHSDGLSPGPLITA